MNNMERFGDWMLSEGNLKIDLSKKGRHGLVRYVYFLRTAEAGELSGYSPSPPPKIVAASVSFCLN